MKALIEMDNKEKAYLLVRYFPDIHKELSQFLNKEKYRNRKRLAKVSRKKVDKAIDKLFIKLHRKAGTITGDITPEQQCLLEDTKAQLVLLIVEHISQNLQQDI